MTREDRQEEALRLVHRLNVNTAVDNRSARRWNVICAVAGIVLALIVLGGPMIWAAWR